MPRKLAYALISTLFFGLYTFLCAWILQTWFPLKWFPAFYSIPALLWLFSLSQCVLAQDPHKIPSMRNVLIFRTVRILLALALVVVLLKWGGVDKFTFVLVFMIGYVLYLGFEAWALRFLNR